MSTAFDYCSVVAKLAHELPLRPRTCVAIDGFRSAAVAVALVDKHGATYVPLTVRSVALSNHSGQISLPGGVHDQADESLARTAARELEEELGVPSERLELLGLVDDMPTPSGFVITPAVFAVGPSPIYTCSPAEVAEVFEAPLQLFADAEARIPMGERELGGVTYRLCAFDYAGHHIWGATARILSSIACGLA